MWVPSPPYLLPMTEKRAGWSWGLRSCPLQTMKPGGGQEAAEVTIVPM